MLLTQSQKKNKKHLPAHCVTKPVAHSANTLLVYTNNTYIVLYTNIPIKAIQSRVRQAPNMPGLTFSFLAFFMPLFGQFD